MMPLEDENVAITLASIPRDIIRQIIGQNKNRLESLQMISPAWKALVNEREAQINRLRASLPLIDVEFAEDKGVVAIDVYSDDVDDLYFEGLGIEITHGWASNGSLHFRECYYAILRGNLILLTFLVQMLVFPFIPSYGQFLVPIIFAGASNYLSRSEDACKKFVSEYLKIVSGIDTLSLTNLSEQALFRIKKLIRKEQIEEIEFKVEDFNLEQRANLLDLVHHHSTDAVVISAKQCEIEGLRTYLRELSVHVRYLVIRQDGIDCRMHPYTMFNRDWAFWSDLSGRLLKKGMRSVIVVCGATVKEFR